MRIMSFECGPVETIGYLVTDDTSAEGVLIDTPPDAAKVMLPAIASAGIRISHILITHGHWDHVGEAARIAGSLGAPVLIHAADAGQLRAPSTFGFPMPAGIAGMEPDGFLREGDTISCGDFSLAVLHIPGHTPGHVCLWEAEAKILFAGDVLFAGSIGRADLPGGSYDTLLQQICAKLLILPDETVVYPGHGPSTTIGREKSTNPFLREYLDCLDDEIR
jgi:hydroxyacylglutathione hydrolase